MTAVRIEREIERKYDAAADFALPDLTGLPGALGEPEVQRLDATYFDTTDLRLAARGITLRRRTGGTDAGWHLKFPVGRGVKEEIRLPLGRAAKTVPKELAGLVRAYTRGRALRPIARIETTRTLRRLLDAQGNPLAEIADDAVTGQALDRTEPVAWHELEVELTGGEPGLLDLLDERVRAAGASPAGSGSKLLRLLDHRVPAAPAPDTAALGPRSPAGAVILAYLRSHRDALLAADPLVRRDADDAVHQMRVATRRLRSTLQIFGTVVDKEATRPLRAELRWLAGELSGARDREVMLERLQRRVDELPPHLVLGPVRERITRHLEEGMAEARARALSALDEKRYLELLDALDALIDDPPLTPAAARPARVVLPRLVRRAWKRLDRELTEAVAKTVPAERDAALHEARKSAKRARYAAEAVVSAFGRPARDFARRMTALQELLGDHQDSVVCRDTLRAIGLEAYAEGENAFTYGLLIGTEMAVAQRDEYQLPAVWKQAAKGRYHRWLG